MNVEGSPLAQAADLQARLAAREAAEQDLSQAQISIDILDMLHEKMKGNLSPGEGRMFTQVSDHQAGRGRDGLTMPLRQIVEDYDIQLTC